MSFFIKVISITLSGILFSHGHYAYGVLALVVGAVIDACVSRMK